MSLFVGNEYEVIDLTNSFTVARASRPYLDNDQIIDVDTENSFNYDTIDNIDNIGITNSRNDPPVIPNLQRRKTKVTKCNKELEAPKNMKDVNKAKGWGECPICWDSLGTSPLASTKCGHVYCMKCLEECLKVEKRCPTCRRHLKGCHGYHPLYINIK